MELIESEQQKMPVVRDDDDTALEAVDERDTAVEPVDDDEDEGDGGNEPGDGQPWLRILGAVLAAIIILFLLAILARWIYHLVTNDNQPAPPTSQNNPASSGQKKQPGATNTPAPSDNSGSSATGGNQNLPNNGPGDVAAIFVGVSLAAAGLHFIYSLRKDARQRG